MDRIAVCAIFKDDAPYLLEWLAFHKMIGIDLFVLYDNGSGDGGSDLIRNSSFARNVTLINWAERPGQLSGYDHFRINHAGKFTWVAFIGLDEFIMPVGGGSIRDPLMRRDYQQHSAILLQRLVFGPSGHGRKPRGLVLENYTWRLPESSSSSRQVSSLARPRDLLGFDHATGVAECSGPTCNTRGETVPPCAVQPIECHDGMVIHRYFTRSREEWEIKLQRDAGDVTLRDADNAFADIANHATVEDTRALRFMPRLRALLATEPT